MNIDTMFFIGMLIFLGIMILSNIIHVMISSNSLVDDSSVIYLPAHDIKDMVKGCSKEEIHDIKLAVMRIKLMQQELGHNVTIKDHKDLI